MRVPNIPPLLSEAVVAIGLTVGTILMLMGVR